MTTDEIDKLIRMAEVLKVRSNLLASELAKSKRGPQAARAQNVSTLADNSAQMLKSILRDILNET